MNGATLAIACYAAFVSTSALVWQIASFWFQGGRAEIRLHHGIVNDQIEFITDEPTLPREDFPDYRPHMFFATVRNRGRQAIYVVQLEIAVQKGISMGTGSFLSGPDVPHAINAGEQVRWIFSIPTLHEACVRIKNSKGLKQIKARLVVTLGSGKQLTSKEWIEF